MKDQDALIEEIKKNVIQGRRNAEDDGLDEDLLGQPGVEELVREALEKEIKVKDILVRGLSQGMEVVGSKFEKHEYFIPDMLAAAEAVGAATEILEPYLQQEGQTTKGKFIIATVEKDQHDIGKNIVAIMLKGAGFQVIDLGINVPSDQVVEAVQREKASYVGLSALLDTTMKYMGETIQKLEEKDLRKDVKVFIGGAPTTPEFAEQIGADIHCRDAFAAVNQANKYVSER